MNVKVRACKRGNISEDMKSRNWSQNLYIVSELLSTFAHCQTDPFAIKTASVCGELKTVLW